MLRPFTLISIQQVTDFTFTDSNGSIKTIKRNKSFTLDFAHTYCIESSWENHTNNCVIEFPKNILLQSGDSLFKQSGSYNVILGGTTNQGIDGTDITIAPLILKGDIITVQDGYWYRNKNQKDIQVGDTQFVGYVSKVNSDTPIEIECEDNFYLLKRTPFDSTVWNKKSSNGDTSLYSLCKHIIELVNDKFHNVNPLYPELSFFEVPNSISAKFSLGYLDIGYLTCAQVLHKLKNQFHFESSFGSGGDTNTLQFGVTIYNENKANSSNFFAFRDVFNGGILQTSANIFPNHNLEYSNKGDIELSTIVKCKVIKPTGKITKDGKEGTKYERMRVFVYWDLPTETFKYIDISKAGTVIPENKDGGERHECYYPVDLSGKKPTTTDLYNLGMEQLKKYYYTGFKGFFTTFGFPFVNWNDNVNLIDPIYSDRNGQYKVKKVVRKFSSVEGQGGISQEIHLDYKQQVKLPTNIDSIFMI